jgi:hypothetical protein
LGDAGRRRINFLVNLRIAELRFHDGCQVHDISNLPVSDGSQFITGATDNPSLTIVVLALRLHRSAGCLSSYWPFSIVAND